jgi:hypothetical protein
MTPINDSTRPSGTQLLRLPIRHETRAVASLAGDQLVVAGAPPGEDELAALLGQRRALRTVDSSSAADLMKTDGSRCFTDPSSAG